MYNDLISSPTAARPRRGATPLALGLMVGLAVFMPALLFAIPSITTQPQTQTVSVGANATFSVAALGNPPLSYQWRLNSVNLPGQTTPTLTLNNVQTSQSGGYSVVVTDSGSVGGGSGLLSGLISYWKLDEAGGTRLDAHGLNPLSDIGGVGQAAGKLGNSARFVGTTLSGNILSHDHNADLALGGDTPFSFSCWIWMEQKDDFKGFVLKRVTSDAVTTEYQLYYSIAFDRLRFGISDGVNINHAEAVTLGSPPLFAWMHVVFWHDAVGNTINIQINNGPVDTSPWPFGTQTTSGPFTLGQAIPGFYFLNGRMDGVGFWKRVLTPAERASLFNSGAGMEYPFGGSPPALSGSVTSVVATLTVTGGAPVITAQPQSVLVLPGQNATFNAAAVGIAPLSYQWRFNGANIPGATAVGFTVSNAQPANAGNYSVVVTNGLGSATSVNASLAVGNTTAAGSALIFDGVNDFVSVPDSPSVRITNTITVEAWIRRSATGVQHSIVEKYDCLGAAPAVGGYAFRVQADDKLAFHTENDCNSGAGVVGATSLQSNTWYHVAGVWDGAQLRVFVNGVIDGFAAVVNSPKAGNTPLKIGERGNGGTSFGGVIDEVRLWNVARTDTQILNNMSLRLAGNEPGLAGYWRFDEGAGSVANDSSPNGNTGTLVNGPIWITSTAPVFGLLNVATVPASALTGNSATLNATVNPGGASTTAFFQYGTTAGYGSITPLQNIGGGATALPVAAGVTGLSAGTTYHYRIVAFNTASGTNFGSDTLFTTLSLPPVAVTQTATAVTGVDATFNGTVNPNGSGTTASYQWGTTTNFGNLTVPHVVGSGISAVSVPGVTTGLAPGTAYFFRLMAFNTLGTNLGGTVSFTTPLPPLVTTQPATAPGGAGATLNGTAQPNGAATTASFQWGLTTNLGSATVSQSIGAGAVSVPVAAVLSGLLPATSYFYRLVAFNAGGTNVGTLTSFTTLPLPLAVTLPASNITGAGAMLNGLVNANGFDSTAFFQWGTTTSYGNTTTPQALGNGFIAVPISQSLSGLAAGATYHYRVVAASAAGTNFDSDASFTVPVLPTVATLPATNVTSGGATLNATANPGGGDGVVYFQWGATTNYDNATDPQPVGSGTNTVSVTLALGGLANGTTYHFRAVVSNVVATVFAGDRAFFTIPAGAGTAIQFDGTNDFVNVPFSPSLDLTGPFSIEAWVFRATAGAQHSVLEKYGCSGIGGYVLRIRADDKLLFGTRDDCTTGVSLAGATSLAANTWYHVAGVWDGLQLRVYVNGVLDGALDSTRAPKSGATSLRLGARGNDAGTPFNGVMDEVRLWNLARTQAQLQTNMNRVLVGTEAGLAGYWRFDDGLGLAALDSSAGGNAGALTNGPVWVVSTAPIIGLLSVTTSPANGVTGFSANLNGSISTAGNSTAAFYQWGTNAQFGNTTPVQNFGAGSNAVAVAQPISGLLPGTVYSFRLVAFNASAGTNTGATLSFTTLAPPTAVTLPAGAITGASASLNGSVNPLGAATTALFQWGTTTNYDNSTVLQNIGAGTSAVAVNSPLSGLAPGTTYHFRLGASNSAGTNFDGDVSFTTLAPPTAVTQPASSVTPSAAALNGSANPGGALTTIFFQWGTTTNYGNTTAAQNVGSSTSDVAVSGALSGLAFGTEYHFRVLAANSVATVIGNDATFSTSLPLPPVAGFTGAPTSGVRPLTVNFTNLTDGVVSSYNWNFGDGTASATTHPTMTYSNAGVYTVTLSATGPGGNSSVAITNFIIVTNPPAAPVAALSGSPTAGVAPLTVSFTNLTTGAATSYAWDFGDTTTSTAANPMKTYPIAGIFTVKLTAMGLGGSTTNVQLNFITVTNPPLPAGPGMALQFDGVNDYVNIPDSPSVRLTNTITVEAWIRRSVTGVQHSIVEKYGCVGLGGYALRVTAADKLMFGTRDDCGTGTSAIGGTTLLASTWYHVAGLWDGTQIRLYVNGVLDGLTITTRNPKAGTTPLRIGARGNEAGTSFNGVIDEVRLWNVARTVPNLQTNMNRRLTGTEANLAGYWRLDEGTGLTTTDSSMNGNTGTLTNGPIWITSTAPISGTAGSGGGGALAAAIDEAVTPVASQLSVSMDAENNAVLVGLTAAPYSEQEIESSTDLSHWTPLTSVPVTLDGTFEFRDEIVPGIGARFYRVREAQPVSPASPNER